MDEARLSHASDPVAAYRMAHAQATRLQGERKREATRALLRSRRELVLEFIEQSLIRASVPDRNVSESLAWFWFNHFNVFWKTGLVGVALPAYVNDVIRRHSSGRFRDLLMGTLTHPAMLAYLNNDRNVKGRLNENYARELLELHCLGVAGGYVQADVLEVARVLTGVGLRSLRASRMPPKLAPLVRSHGEFMFDPRKHDFGAKRVLGRVIDGAGFAEVELLVDVLAAHPSTARHVAHKLGVYLRGDAVSESTVARAAAVFSESGGDIAKTVAAITQDGAVNGVSGLGTFKDPYRYVMSAVHLLSCGQSLKEAKPVARWLSGLGQPLFGCSTPDGYSLFGRDWLSSGQLTQRFELAREMVQVIPRLVAKPESAESILAKAPARELLRSLGRDSRLALEKADDGDERLALLLSSPEFMHW